MRIEKYLFSDRIEVYLYGDKSKDYMAKLEIYHWRVMKEYGIEINDLLREAFSGR